MDYWETQAQAALRAEMKRCKFSYKKLARGLEAAGYPVEEKVLMNKVSRGKFSFSFFLLCMAAMGATTLQLPPVKAQHTPQGKT